MQLPRVIAIAALALITLGTLGIGSALAGGDGPVDKASRIGQLVRAAVTGQTVRTSLTIDGVDVNEATLRVFEAPFIAEGRTVADARAAAIAALARQMALKTEIARRGISVSDLEVDSFISSWRAREASAGPDANATASAYLQATGQTSQEYWSSPSVRGVAALVIARNKLAAQLVPDAANDQRALAAVEHLLDEAVKRMAVRDAR